MLNVKSALDESCNEVANLQRTKLRSRSVMLNADSLSDGADMRIYILLVLIWLSLAAYAGPLAGLLRQAARQTERESSELAKRAIDARAQNLLRARAYDLARDGATQAKPMLKPRTVHRYTSEQSAQRALSHGVAPGSHFSAHAARGRPLSAEHAQAKFGLSAAPQVRMTIRLPTGQPVRSNKVVAGAPGVGELTSSARVGPKQITRITPMRSATSTQKAADSPKAGSVTGSKSDAAIGTSGGKQ